jgi:hypothetical protein
MRVPVEMLRELRHHISYVQRDITNGSWTIYITINIK